MLRCPAMRAVTSTGRQVRHSHTAASCHSHMLQDISPRRIGAVLSVDYEQKLVHAAASAADSSHAASCVRSRPCKAASVQQVDVVAPVNHEGCELYRATVFVSESASGSNLESRRRDGQRPPPVPLYVSSVLCWSQAGRPWLQLSNDTNLGNKSAVATAQLASYGSGRVAMAGRRAAMSWHCDTLTLLSQAFRGRALAARPAVAQRAQQRQRLAVAADAMKVETEYATTVKVGQLFCCPAGSPRSERPEATQALEAVQKMRPHSCSQATASNGSNMHALCCAVRCAWTHADRWPFLSYAGRPGVPGVQAVLQAEGCATKVLLPAADATRLHYCPSPVCRSSSRHCGKAVITNAKRNSAQCRRGHFAVARHPAAGEGRHLQFRVRDPQGDVCQDGGRHGGWAAQNPKPL